MPDDSTLRGFAEATDGAASATINTATRTRPMRFILPSEQ
jgi:hypothetical protein